MQGLLHDKEDHIALSDITFESASPAAEQISPTVSSHTVDDDHLGGILNSYSIWYGVTVVHVDSFIALHMIMP